MSNDWIEIGQIDDIPKLGARIVKRSEGDIALFRNSQDAIFALNNRCPHKGGPLSEGLVSGNRVTCPLHNWMIDLQNGQAIAPDVGCTPAYPIKLEGRTIFLNLTANSPDH